MYNFGVVMTEEEKKLLNSFETQLRHLIYLHDELKRENAELKKLLENEKLKNEKVQAQYDELEVSYTNLKTATAISLNGSDVKETNDKLNINLQIADSYYPLTINRDEEETVREAAKQVNIRLNAYREHYRNVAPEKIIAMVAYQFSLEKLQLLQRNDTQPYTAKIEELTEMLEEYFRNEE